MSKEGQYFEAGKYDVLGGVAKPKPKGKSFAKTTSSPCDFGHLREKDILEKPALSVTPDRSLYRGGWQTTHRSPIKRFDKDLPRPPLSRATKVYYDETNEEIAAQVFEHEMSHDAETLTRAVERRHDSAPRMEHSLTRDRAVRGSRHFQDDRTWQMKLGMTFPETESELYGSIESRKESPSRVRSRIPINFKLNKGRARDLFRQKSPLHKPRDMAAPDFERLAPLLGYDARQPAWDVAPERVRAYESIDHWEDTLRFEELELAYIERLRSESLKSSLAARSRSSDTMSDSLELGPEP